MNNLQFTKKSPCNNCPYRKDAPLRFWDKSEFKQLLEIETSQFGSIYGCHKKDGNVCVGWLMNQDDNNLPSIALRLRLAQTGISRKYLDSLTCPSERFETVEDMCFANYPELITEP